MRARSKIDSVRLGLTYGAAIILLCLTIAALSSGSAPGSAGHGSTVPDGQGTIAKAG